MEIPNIDLTSAKFVSWIDVKNIQYSLKNMTLIIDTSDMPLFMLIKFIYFLPDNNYPFLICNKFTTITYYDEHVQLLRSQFLDKIVNNYCNLLVLLFIIYSNYTFIDYGWVNHLCGCTTE
ncbi:Uncharacterized protein FWK35_00014104 [Aphis craccivora]|uniref:Uncharacterized protein n=1 Tax=Aphis craccivora TaxID=307492 RepID=A0A6G0X725_APHCR|nr:Uncharacterized protein FWK35_00014104 [Aphis craccivora]